MKGTFGFLVCLGVIVLALLASGLFSVPGKVSDGTPQLHDQWGTWCNSVESDELTDYTVIYGDDGTSSNICNKTLQSFYNQKVVVEVEEGRAFVVKP